MSNIHCKDCGAMLGHVHRPGCPKLGEPTTGHTEWQPIETAPKDGTLLVLGAKNGVWLGKYLPVYQSGFRPDNPWSSMMLNHDHMAERFTRPTHWMPLPAPPAALAPASPHKESQNG